MSRSPDSLSAAGIATRRWRAAQAGETSARVARNEAWRAALDDGHSVAEIARAAEDTRDIIHMWKHYRAKGIRPTASSPDQA